jgi:hypothetical protein
MDLQPTETKVYFVIPFTDTVLGEPSGAGGQTRTSRQPKKRAGY